MPVADTRRFLPSQEKSITLEEHNEWASRMWRRMDHDGSGSITRQELDCEEFRSVLRSILAPASGAVMGGASYARAEMNTDQALSFCLRKADLNDDKLLSSEEFRSFLLTLRHQDLRKETSNLIFALFDLDSDQMIDESEFREIFRFFLGHKPTEVQFQEQWGKLDQEGAHKVTLEQYTRWLQTSTNPVFHQYAPFDASSQVSVSMTRSTSSGFYPSKKNLPRLTRKSIGGESPAAVWNDRFTAGTVQSKKLPQALRNYFSRPQSLPELTRYYESHRGFRDRLKQLKEAEEKKKSRLEGQKDEIALARSKLGSAEGWMRNPVTGKREVWEEHWQNPRCMKQMYQPGTLSLRCPAVPPTWLYSND